MDMEPFHPLLLIRHAEAEHHVQEITGGWTDTELTEKGVRQATLLGERLCVELDNMPLYLGTGNLRRAIQTASIVGHRLGLNPTVYAPLTDLNNGIAADKTHAEAKVHAIPPTQPFIDWQPYPEAESWRQFFTRVTSFIGEFSSRQKGASILVTHSATIHVIIAWWLGLPVESRTHFEVAPARFTALTFNKWGERTLERLNDTAHLYARGMGNPIRLS